MACGYKEIDIFTAPSSYVKDDIVYVRSGTNTLFFWAKKDFLSLYEFQSPTGVLHNDYWHQDFVWTGQFGTSFSNERERINQTNFDNSPYVDVKADEPFSIQRNLNLSFELIKDRECQAILTFLDSHHGVNPFRFSNPTFYMDKTGWYRAKSWQHSFVFYNAHSIDIKLEELSYNG